jgi:catechol 2,3-dioxygenase-like lactoylglutathione lyase family enzyme
MTIELNHTIVPAHDNTVSAQFYADLFGFSYDGPLGHFAPVQIKNQGLTLDFDTREHFNSQHYAFKVSEDEFDEIFDRVQAWGLTFGSGPGSSRDGQTNHWNGGRGVYFHDPNGHLLELLTRDYTAEQFS